MTVRPTVAGVRIAALLAAVALGLLAARALAPAGAADRIVPVRIDIDADGADRLTLLPGIGPRLAERIVADRAARGPFEDADGLARVPGIGPRTVDRVRPWVE